MNEKEIEAAARRLCAIRGIDPEVMVGHGAEPNAQGHVPAVWLHSPAWRRLVPEIVAHLQVTEALRPPVVAYGDQWPERALTVFGTPTVETL